MQERDGRSIPDAALEVLRERAVVMHKAGNAQLAIAAALGVHKNTVHRWLKGWRIAGATALKAKKRGRRHAAKRLLDAEQAAEVRQLMIGYCPDQLDLPWALWSREAVRDLAQARCGVRLALRTVSDYLRRWRFTPPRPIRRASERQEATVQPGRASPEDRRAGQSRRCRDPLGRRDRDLQPGRLRPQLRAARANTGDQAYGAAAHHQHDLDRDQSRFVALHAL